MASGLTRSRSDSAADSRGTEADDSRTSVEVAVALGANEVLLCCRKSVLRMAFACTPIPQRTCNSLTNSTVAFISQQTQACMNSVIV